MERVKKSQNSRGITLIALVVTIVVLLILAGVTIATLTGDNGILNKAENAKEETEEAKIEEENILANYEEVIDEYTNPEIKLMKLVVNSGESKVETLPIVPNAENNYTINWGDGTTEKIDPEANATHTYEEASKEYTVTIDGTVKEIDAYNVSDTDSIIKVEQWGELGLTKLNFFYCNNLEEIASPTKNSFKNVTDFSGTFESTRITSIPENLFSNCPNVTDFSFTFCYCNELKGSAIELWKRGTNDSSNDYEGTPDGYNCFCSATQLDNYEEIPMYWKASLM